MSERLEGRTGIVTGAASGIGRAILHRLIADGAVMIAVDRDGDGLAESVATAPDPTRAHAEVGDVVDAGLPDRLAARLAALGAPLDILVNNAGVGGGAMAEDMADADFERLFEINVFSVFRLSRFAIGLMKPRGCGVILNLASVYSFVGAHASAAYAPSKTAVAGMTRQLATDYGPDGIRVVGLAPGLVETPMTAERIRTEAWRRRIYIDECPLRRVGQPEDVAAAASFLVSDDAAFVTGEILKVDGGWVMGRYPRPPEG